jgi:hypothetical protein
VGLLGASLALIAFSFASLVTPGFEQLPNRPDPANFVAVTIAFVSLLSVGAMLAILRPGNPIGWIFLVGGSAFILGIFTTEYVGRSIYLGWDLPGHQLIDWLGSWSGSLAVTLFVVWTPLLFPDGRLPSPRWRPIGWVTAIASVVSIAALALEPVGPVGPDGPTGYGGYLPNPVAAPGPLGELASLVAHSPLLLVFGGVALTALAVRVRRSRGVERQQLKWFLLAAGFLLVAVIVGVVTELAFVWYFVILGLAALPIAAAVAVLRYRLYEIDRIISRTLAYTVVTATLALVFVAIVLGLQAALERFVGGNTIAVAASTLVVAALFQPLRRRVQRVVDRRFDRARYDGERTLAAFAVRLRDQVELETIETELHSVVRQTMAPSSSALWIHRAEGRG